MAEIGGQPGRGRVQWRGEDRGGGEWRTLAMMTGMMDLIRYGVGGDEEGGVDSCHDEHSDGAE
jgi:hypothetical protein